MNETGDHQGGINGTIESGSAADSTGVGQRISPQLAAIGILIAATGLLVFVVPEVVSISPQPLAIYGLALVAVLLGVLFTYKRTFLHVEQARTPTVEPRTTTSIPGVGVDAVLRGPFPSRGDRLQARKDVSKRLRESAIDVLSAVRSDASEATIQADLESGRWTDDPQAATFFSEESPSQTLRDRLATMGTGNAERYRTLVEAVVTELADQYLSEADAADIEDVDLDRPRSDRASSPGVGLTNRWRGIGAVSLLAIGVGAGLGSSPLLLVAGSLSLVVGVAAFDREPPAALSIERTVEPTEPSPGEAVTVRVRIENDSERLIPDLRIVDGVPDGMTVVNGTPRHGDVLRPGATTWFEYTARAHRGTHTFDGSFVITRNLTGSSERVARIESDDDSSIRYRAHPDVSTSFPLRKLASRHVGRILTDVGGSGLEFHSVRDYRSGDPLSRIDWNRAAQGRDLATLQFREERSATVVLLVDARADAYVAPETESPSAIDRSILGATEVFLSLLDSDDKVGLAALSSRWCWLSPDAGHVHWARAEQLLAENTAFSTHPPEQPLYPHVRLPKYRKRFPSGAQLVLFSPLCDDEIVTVARELEAYGYPVTLVSPDPTNTRTAGEILARIERQRRLSKLRGSDIRVIDWGHDERLPLAIEQAQRRWSK